MSLSPLIRTCFRSSRAQPLRTGLLIFGIALGVAGVIAIDIARTSVSKSFELSTAALTARSTHQILGNDFTIPQSLFTRIRTGPGIHKSAPVISRLVTVRELAGRSLTLMGVDPFSEGPFRTFQIPEQAADSTASEQIRQVLVQGRGVIMSGELARSHGLSAGDALTLVLGQRQIPTRIGALLDSGEKMLEGILVADIGLAQEILEMGDRITRIDIILETPEQEAAVKALLGPGQVLVRTSAQNRTIRGLSRSFETSLTAFSILVLFMGIFLIYNTVSFSVARRRTLNGTFRALGATRRDIFWAVQTEVMAYALVGSALGLILGIALGKGAVHAVCATVSDMYYTLTVSQTHIALGTLAKGVATGLGAALVSSLAPAVNAARTLPVTLMQTSSPESRLNRFIPLLTCTGLAVLGVALVLFRLDRGGMGLVFAGVFMIFGSASLLSPVLILGLSKGLSALIARGAFYGNGPKRHRIMARMGIRNVTRSLSRTSVLIASLMVVISVYIGIDTMTRSFRQSISHWVDGHIGGDIHISSTDELNPALEPDLPDRVRAMDGVAGVAAYNIYRSFSKQSGEVHLFSYIRDTSKKEWTWLDPAAGKGDEARMQALMAQGWILVSEIFARQHGLSPETATGGLGVTMETLKGPQSFRVAGIFRDFFMGGGRAVVSRHAMKTFWGRDEITAMQVFLSPGLGDNGAVSGVMKQIRAASDHPDLLRLRSGPVIKARILGVFDRTFLITIALQVLTALVALTGIINSVMALILERSREFGILRACGAEPSQVRTLILWECSISGFMAGVLSLPLGLMLSWVLVAVVNFRAFGWTYDIEFSLSTLALAVGFSTLAALGAGVVPAVKAGQVPVVEALRTE